MTSLGTPEGTPAVKPPAMTPSETMAGSAAGLPAPRRELPRRLEPAQIDALLIAALDEDRSGPDRRRPGPLDSAEASGDITSRHAVPVAARARAHLLCKTRGRLAGIDVFARTFELCDPGAAIRLEARDGDEIAPGQVLARIEGRARALLLAERTALNFVQRLSGIATTTARYVARAGGRVRVLDTRKTTPNLRLLEKYAVRCGGGENHRFGLYDEAMVKNNHVDLAGRPLADVLADLRAALGPAVRITAEARDEAEALAGVQGGADVVMLDNFDVERARALCPRLCRAAEARERPLEIEVSGGITEDNVGRFAEAGVDRISVGALTHSAPALDLSLSLEPIA